MTMQPFPIDPIAPYTTAAEHVADELALVGMFVRRALSRSADSKADATDDRDLGRLFAAVEARLLATRPRASLPFDAMRLRLGLTLTEQRVLWTLIGFEIDDRLRKLLRLIATEQSAAVTLGTLLTVVYAPDDLQLGICELGPAARLSRLRLVELTGGTGARDAPISQRTVRVCDRIVELALGIARIDHELGDICDFTPSPPPLDGLLIPAPVKDRVASYVASAATVDRPLPVLVVAGPEGSGRSSLVAGAAAAHKLPVLTVRCTRLPSDSERFVAAMRAAAREASIFNAVLVLDDLDVLVGDVDRGLPDRIGSLDRAGLSDLVGPVLATSTTVGRPWAIQRGTVGVELSIPSEDERVALWTRELGAAVSPDVVDVVAARYPVSGGVIQRVGHAVRSERSDLRETTIVDVHEALRGVIDTRLGNLGMRVTTGQTWDDVVLPDDTMAEVRELVARVMHRRQVMETWGFARKVGRGLGLSALFSGPPGTGKTMVAGLIAKDLGLDLYQVDLSRIVSKWVGETEKNLASVFHAAEAGHAVLLFDEADSLFAKRTDVKSSMDRYANLEVNYLLQRMDAFAGITILTTNHDTAIDDAFRRRLSFRIDFPMPAEEEREHLWRVLVPDEAALGDDVDFGALAKAYEMTGGYIKNVVVRAAYFAAVDGTSITMAHLRRAAALEMTAMGKVVRGAR